MTDCSSIHGSTSSSSDLNSHHGAMSKIRTIRLIRPHSGNRNNLTLGHPPFSSYGFSLRGGREYGTGFFVSNVVKGSEADLKGLQIGDQIVRVGGGVGNYRVDDAVHKELSQFIMNQDRLTLKVRGVGILPVKEKISDPLTWHVVPLNSSMVFDDATPKDVRIVLNVAPRTKLGCGICKGPDWKPGIFVQFTKENGIARESGLRPGDQILSCNGINFGDIAFNEAVSIMKNSSVLELFVRTCVGLDLFPGESSGYNSSASSITGDQSPSWGEAAKRLSIVREESTSSSDRMNGTFRFRDRRKDKPLPVEVPKIPSSFTKVPNTKGSNQNTTIIKLSEDGPTMINNTLIPDVKNINNTVYEEIGNQKVNSANGQEKLANICFVSKQNETKIVTVEVHRSSSTKIDPPPQFANNKEAEDLPQSSSGQSSLSSAINEELRRRAEKKLKAPPPPPDVPFKLKSQETETTIKTAKGTTMGGQVHNILMDEFKKAHQKMFRNGYVENEHQQINDRNTEANTITAVNNNERKLEERQILKRNGPPVPLKIQSDDHLNDVANNTDLKKITNELPQKKKAPPPPPNKKLDKQVSLPAVISEPLPDYDTSEATLVKEANGERAKGTMGRMAMQEAIKANGDLAEMESIESFQLNNPSSQIPVPPPMYFSLQKSGPPTMKKIQRPVSVIINSYDDKKEPGKFDFIDVQSNGNPYNNQRADEDMSTRLKNELEKTLSRSNLRRRSDSMDDLLKADMRSANNIIQFNNNLNKDSMKSSFDASKGGMRKYSNSTLNGILKNGTTKVNGTANGHPKNISFGEVKQ